MTKEELYKSVLEESVSYVQQNNELMDMLSALFNRAIDEATRNDAASEKIFPLVRDCLINSCFRAGVISAVDILTNENQIIDRDQDLFSSLISDIQGNIMGWMFLEGSPD